MRMVRFCLLLFSVCVSGTQAWAAESWLEEDYSTLTENVKAFHMGGTAGNVGLHGRRAFPLAVSPQHEVVVAAGYFRDWPRGGRIVAMAHTSFADAKSDDALQFLHNVAHWAGRSGVPRVVCIGVAPKFWLESGARAAIPGGPIANALEGADVAVVNIHGGAMKDALPALTEFASNGGGVIITATPWAAAAPQLEAANELLGLAGLSFANSGPKDAVYPVLAQTPSELWSSLNAIEAVVAYQKGQRTLTVDEQQLCAAALDAALGAKERPAEVQTALAELGKVYGKAAPAKNGAPLEVALAKHQGKLKGR